MKHSVFIIDPQTGEPKGCLASELLTTPDEPPTATEDNGTEKQAANRSRKD